VFPSQQRDLWRDLTAVQIFREVVKALPSGVFREGNIWHIGNREELDSDWTYFRLGKASRTKIEVFHNGNFRDAVFETAPYTHVLVNYPYEIVAIAKKPKLKINVVEIAKRLRRLLDQSSRTAELNAHFELNVIGDPETFLHFLRTATVIKRFSYEFDRENIFDVNKDFIRPLEKAIEAVDGKKGVAILKGESLRVKPLEEISRSAASTGNEATVVFRRGRKGKTQTKKLRGNPASIQVDHLDELAQQKKACAEILEKYKKVRESPTSDE
jgi:hypothetical protein